MSERTRKKRESPREQAFGDALYGQPPEPPPQSPQSQDEHMANNIVRLREEAGMTQEVLAKLLREAGLTQFHQMTVYRVEKGKRRLSVTEAQTIAKFFGVSLDELLAPPEWVTLVSATYEQCRELDRVTSFLSHFISAHTSGAKKAQKLLERVDDDALTTLYSLLSPEEFDAFERRLARLRHLVEDKKAYIEKVMEKTLELELSDEWADFSFPEQQIKLGDPEDWSTPSNPQATDAETRTTTSERSSSGVD